MNYHAADVVLMPCAITGEASCIWEQDKVEEYIGNEFKMLVYHN